MTRFDQVLLLVLVACIGCGSSGTELSGTVEATLVEASFPLPGLVTERRVSEGDRVKKGQVLACLDDAELREEAALRQADVDAARAALTQLETGAREEEIAMARAAEKVAKALLAEMEAGARPQEIARAKAAVAAAQAGLAALENGSRPQEVEKIEAALQAARTEVSRLNKEVARLDDLHENGLLSDRDLDAMKSAYEGARAKFVQAEKSLSLAKEGPRRELIDQARAQLESAKQALMLVQEGPRKEAIDRARAQFEQARASREMVEAGPRQEIIDQARARLEQATRAKNLANTRLERAVLKAPCGGTVLSHHVEAGEYVTPGAPVVTVGDLATVWVRAFVAETELGRIKTGQAVEVRSDTYPDKVYPGTLTFIAPEAEFTPKNVQTRKERVRLVYRVKVTVPNPDGELKPGMPVDLVVK